MYYIYILECADGTLYTGSTNDLQARVIAHNTLKTGAKYTKARRPVRLVYSERFRTKSKAMQREWEIKQMGRKEKLELMK
jgi:putative endonuclease